MNGLTLAAFSQGLHYKQSLKPTGEKLAQFLMSLWNGKTLRRSAANAKDGTLYDYAAVSWGLLKWAKASGDQRARQVGNAIANTAWQRFYKNGRWLENPNSLLPQGVKQSHIEDSSLISAEALLLEASYLTKNPALVAKANTVRKLVSRSLQTDLFAYASLLSIKRLYKYSGTKEK